MAKQSGLGSALWVDGVDVSGDTSSLSEVRGGPALLPFTGIDKYAMERVGGVRDGALTASTFFNPGTAAAHPTYSTLPRTDRILTYCTGTALGDPGACLNAKQIGYDPVRGEDGSLIFTVSAVGNKYALEWCALATAGKRTDTSATNGSGIDGAASSAFGLQAYLHVFAFTGTSVTVTLQHSSDNAVGDPYAAVTGGAFTAATAAGAQRLATSSSLTIKRWLRVVTTGTFSSATFAVLVNRNATSTVF